MHSALLYQSASINDGESFSHFSFLLKNAEHSFNIFLMTDESISTVSIPLTDLCFSTHFQALNTDYLQYISSAVYFVISSEYTKSLLDSLNLNYLFGY